MSSQNETNLNANKNNGYFSIIIEKLPNIADRNFNNNYLTAKSPERARSCSPALASQNSSISIASDSINLSEININIGGNVHSNMN